MLSNITDFAKKLLTFLKRYLENAFFILCDACLFFLQKKTNEKTMFYFLVCLA